MKPNITVTVRACVFRRINRLKLFVTITVSLFVFLLSALFVFASDQASLRVLETPNTRIVIDGVCDTYADVTLNVNDHVLLPFRELLTNLGVPNDNEHIAWNDADRSVTVKHEENEIRLVIGNPIMLLNGEEITFDVAPYIYPNNSKTYVPVRAVSELLDMLVMWEASSSTVYVREKADYADTVRTLEDIKSKKIDAPLAFAAEIEARVDLELYSEDVDIPGAGDGGVLETSMDMSMYLEAEDVNKMHTTQTTRVLGIPVSMESYTVDGVTVTKVNGIGGTGWVKVPGTGATDQQALLDQTELLQSQFDERPLEDIAMSVSCKANSDGTYTITGEILDIASVNGLIGSMLNSAEMANLGSTDVQMQLRALSFTQKLDEDFNTLDIAMLMDCAMEMTQNAADGNSVRINIDMLTDMVCAMDALDPGFTLNIPSDVSAALN